MTKKRGGRYTVQHLAKLHKVHLSSPGDKTLQFHLGDGWDEHCADVTCFSIHRQDGGGRGGSPRTVNTWTSLCSNKLQDGGNSGLAEDGIQHWTLDTERINLTLFFVGLFLNPFPLFLMNPTKCRRSEVDCHKLPPGEKTLNAGLIASVRVSKLGGSRVWLTDAETKTFNLLLC